MAGEGPSVNRWYWTGSEDLGGGHLFEISSNQFTDRFESCFGLVAFRGDRDHRAMPRCQHHQAKDTLTVHFIVILFHVNLAGKGVGNFDKLSGRAGMNSKLVGDGEFFLGHETESCVGPECDGAGQNGKDNYSSDSVKEATLGRKAAAARVINKLKCRRLPW